MIKINLNQVIKITLTSLIAALACTGIIYAATTVGINISTGGTLDVTGAATFTTASSTGIVKFANINSDTGAISFGNENLTTTGTLNVTGLTTLGSASTTLLSISSMGYIGGSTGLILADGSITDASGAISFGNENLTTTGNFNFATASSTGIVKFSQINSDTGAISFGNENLTTTGNLTVSATTTLATTTMSGDLEVQGNFKIHQDNGHPNPTSMMVDFRKTETGASMQYPFFHEFILNNSAQMTSSQNYMHRNEYYITGTGGSDISVSVQGVMRNIINVNTNANHGIVAGIITGVNITSGNTSTVGKMQGYTIGVGPNTTGTLTLGNAFYDVSSVSGGTTTELNEFLAEPTLTAGSLVMRRGFYAKDVAYTTGTFGTNIGVQIDKMTNASSSYAFWINGNTDGDGDSSIWLGRNMQASLSYDWIDMVAEPNAGGTGSFKVAGGFKVGDNDSLTRVMLGDILTWLDAKSLTANLKTLIAMVDDPSGGTETDYSRYGTAGGDFTYTAGSSWTAGDKVKTALVNELDFDGLDDYLTLTEANMGATNDYYLEGSAFTMCAVVEVVTGGGVAQTIISKSNALSNSEDREFQFTISPAEILQFYINDESANGVAWKETSEALASGLNFVCATHDGTTPGDATPLMLYVASSTTETIAAMKPATGNTDLSFTSIVDGASDVLIGANLDTAGAAYQLLTGNTGLYLYLKGTQLTDAQLWLFFNLIRGYYGM